MFKWFVLLTAFTSTTAAVARRDEWSSPVLMRRLASALVKADLIAAGSDAYRPDDPTLRTAIAKLDTGIVAANRALGECSEILFPSAVRAWPAGDRAAYGHSYRAHMATFRAALIRYRSLLSDLLARPEDDRFVGRLREQRARILIAINQAHLDLMHGR